MIFENIRERLNRHCEVPGECNGCCSECDFKEAIRIVNEVEAEYNNGWIPCDKELPPQPKENPLLDNKPLELYLVSLGDEEYPFRAFWNGKQFTDGMHKLNVTAWQPLLKPYVAVEKNTTTYKDRIMQHFTKGE